MTSGARNCGRRRVLRSARRASAIAARAIGRRPRRRRAPVRAPVARPRRRPRGGGRSSRRTRRRASAPPSSSDATRWPASSSARPRARSRVAPPAIATDEVAALRGRALVAEARPCTSRAPSMSVPSAKLRSRCGRPTSALSAAGVPSATIRPALMIPTRSASWSASSRYCVVRKTVVPSSRRRRTSSHSVIRLAGSSPVVGLVEEQHLGRVDQRHREVEPPAHAARVGADAAVRRLAEADALDQVGGALGDLARRDAVQRRLELHQLAAGHEHVERGLLQGDADALAHQVRLGGDVVAGDERAAAGRAQQRDEHPHGRRLARAVGAQEAVDLARSDLEVDAVDGLEAALELAFERCTSMAGTVPRDSIARATSCRGPTGTAAGRSCSIPSMRLKHVTYAAVACVALALPAAASAKLTEIGDAQPAATPACPAKPCYALTRTTGYQAKIGTKRGTHVIPRAGTARRLVDHARQARQEADQVLRRQPRRRRQRADHRPAPRQQAALPRRRPGRRSEARAVLRHDGPVRARPLDPGEEGLRRRADDADVGPGACRQPADRHLVARLARARARATRRPSRPRRRGANTLAQYYCLYRGARLTYSATFVPDPVAPK